MQCEIVVVFPARKYLSYNGGYELSTLKKKVLDLVKTNFTQIIFQQLSSIQIRVAFQMRGISLPRFSRRSRVRDSVNTSITFCLINKISVSFFHTGFTDRYKAVHGFQYFVRNLKYQD